jgi:hypothetical protein
MKTAFEVCLTELTKLADEMLDPEPPPEPIPPIAAAPPPKKKSPYLEGGKVLGKSILGFGLGYGGGALAAKFIGDALERRGVDTAQAATHILPYAAGAAGMVYPLWQAAQTKEMNDAAERAHQENLRNFPSK